MYYAMDPRHTRLIAAFVVAIGLFLIFAMIYTAAGNPAAVTGIVFKMFLAGIVSGMVISAFGAILFYTAKLSSTKSN